MRNSMKAGVLIISIFLFVSVSLWIYPQEALAQQAEKVQPIEIREYEGEKLSKYGELTNNPFSII